MANQQRAGRLAQEIQRSVSDVLLKRIRDPRVQDVTITGVEVSGDLQVATIYYSILSDYASDWKKAKDGLTAASGLIRKEVGSTLNVYHTPELRFEKDESIQYGSKIDQLIAELNRKQD